MCLHKYNNAINLFCGNNLRGGTEYHSQSYTYNSDFPF